MKTSYFAKKPLQENSIAISLWKPHWFMGQHFVGLAPSEKMLIDYKNGKLSENDYEEKYMNYIVNKFDPKELYFWLGEESTLLCWEKSGKFCHRHLLARWLMKECNVIIEEI